LFGGASSDADISISLGAHGAIFFSSPSLPPDVPRTPGGRFLHGGPARRPRGRAPSLQRDSVIEASRTTQSKVVFISLSLHYFSDSLPSPLFSTTFSGACLGLAGLSDPHHLRYLQPRALGRKASDEFAVPLCRVHHRAIHRARDERAWWPADIDPIKVARKLWKDTRVDEGRVESDRTTADRTSQPGADVVEPQAPACGRDHRVRQDSSSPGLQKPTCQLSLVREPIASFNAAPLAGEQW
jgi:hypothetical protein